MKRINIIYGGLQYSIGDRELSAIEAEIDEAITSNEPRWLDVNFGEGSLRKTRLLITRGIDIALIGIDPDESVGDAPAGQYTNDGSGPAVPEDHQG